MKKLIFISLFIVSATIQAQVYSYIDQNGNTIYTDTVPEQQKNMARKLEIELTPSAAKPSALVSDVAPATNNEATTPAEPLEDGIKTLKLSPPSSPTSNTVNNSVIASDMAENNLPKTEEDKRYHSLKIDSPSPEETFINTDQITIQVANKPSLAADSLYRYLIDNNIISETSNSRLTISDLERGEHQLEIQIINSNKEILATSAKVTFFIRKTTLSDKRRIRPCLIREYGIRPECPLKDKPLPQPRNLLLRATDAIGITAPANQ